MVAGGLSLGSRLAYTLQQTPYNCSSCPAPANPQPQPGGCFSQKLRPSHQSREPTRQARQHTSSPARLTAHQNVRRHALSRSHTNADPAQLSLFPSCNCSLRSLDLAVNPVCPVFTWRLWLRRLRNPRHHSICQLVQNISAYLT